MKYFMLAAAFFCLCFICAADSALMAQWQEDGVAVCTEIEYQIEPITISDSSGGAFIVWHDTRDGSYDIYIQKVDRLGNIMGPDGGVAVCTAIGHQYSPSAVADGSGGIIIAWRDDRGSDSDVYTQRFDKDLNAQWTTDGLVVCNATGSQVEVSIVTDDAGGAIIVWRDQRTGTGDIYAQRVDPSGTMLWTANGSPVCTEASYQYDPAAASDGAEGVIVAWEDYRNGNYDIYAQRLYYNGNGAWNYNGVAVCTDAASQYDPIVVAGECQDAIIVWHEWRSTSYDIYGQRISTSGYPYWTSDGVGICTAADNQEQIDIISDGMGGAFLCWRDKRNSSASLADIYTGRVDIIGNVSWTTPVCAAYFNQQYPALVSDNDGGIIVTWEDYRTGGAAIYAQRLDGSGNILWWWGSDGVLVSDANNTQADPSITTDGSGGALISWEDYRNGVADIYAQRIERNGNWGYPAPSITAVQDVPGDQGGYVNLTWDASRLDPWPDEEIYGYTIWRALSETEAMLMAEKGSAVISGAEGLEPEFEENAIRMQALAGETYYWELISTVNAERRENYSRVLGTLFDSTAVCSEYHYFQVAAHLSDYSWCYYSQPDSGYSVDNLSPCAPAAFAGEQKYQPAGLELTWDPNNAPDMDNYHLYRGASEGFVPGPDNMVSAACDTFYFDSGWSYNGGYWYKLAAVDVHGNESSYAVLAPGDITGEDDPEMPLVNFLGQNYPNPFNPFTTIEFGLEKPSTVRIVIYDAAGRVIRNLLDERRDAGRYSIDWNGAGSGGKAAASGVYFYSIQAGQFTEKKKMILLR